MNKALLSFGFAVLFAAALFVGNYILRGPDHGAAEASVNADKIVQDEGAFSKASNSFEVRRKVAQGGEHFIGLSGAQIETIFDAPELVRADLPTVVWQYRNDECVLDVYFTAAKVDVSASPVVHYDLRAREVSRKAQNADFDVSDCIGDIAQGDNIVSFLDISPFYKSSK